MKKVILASGIITAGCTTLAPPVDMPAAPATPGTQKIVTISDTSKQSSQRNTAQAPGHAIPMGSSVVISVPKVYSKEAPEQESPDSEVFATSGFFNTAEQQIEKELMRQGFNVISREKFEVKLRKERGDTGSTQDSDTALRELKDIAELIRAAEAGDLTSDYLLQINEFRQNDISKYSINLMDYPNYRQLLEQNPELSKQLDAKKTLACDELSASINAKLIHIKSGKIVWIGQHSISNRNLEDGDLQVQVRIKERLGNKEEVENFVAQLNSKDARKRRKANDVISYPEWKIERSLDDPKIISGTCLAEKYPSLDEVRSRISQTLASSIIQSIVVDS